MIVIVDDPRTGLAAYRPRLWQRLAARVLGVALDRRLAAGTSPDASMLLALRARLVVDPGHRAMLAAVLERVLEESRCSELPNPAAIVPNQAAVLAAEPEVRRVAALLRDPGPVPARGVCAVRLLLIEGTGPLFHRRRADELMSALRSASAALDPSDDLW